MSLFGTFRKKGKKGPPPTSTLGSKKGSIFNSTPNLYDTKVSQQSHEISKSSVKLRKHQSHEENDQIGCCDIQRLANSSVTHLDPENTVAQPTCTPPPTPGTIRRSISIGTDRNSNENGSGMKSFMSMVNLASSLKRVVKKDARKRFASAHNLHRIGFDTAAEAVIHEDSATTAAAAVVSTCTDKQGHPLKNRNHSGLLSKNSLKSIKSAPMLDSKSKGHLAVGNKDDDRISVATCSGSPASSFNGEPGVISSSSSTSSCNQSDTASISSSTYSSLTRSINRRRFQRGSKKKNLGTEDPLAFETSVNTKYVQDITKTQLILQGAKKFNMDPKNGIDFFVQQGIIERTPEDVAKFLLECEGLSKTAIGNYLGEYHEFNLAVLSAFVDIHDFTDVLLVQALRQFLWSFRLPGESQKIDRMMECFAKRYCQLNPNLFPDSDRCFLLSFAIIMLNTNLHNPNVKDKMTLEQFIRMTDDGHELDRQFIASLYNSILEEPFKLPPEDGNDFMITFFNPDIEGWLWKKGGQYKAWKRRWFILSNNCLYYFSYTTDRVPRGIIPLENILAKATPLTSSSGKRFRFTLYKKHAPGSSTGVGDYIKSCKTLSDGQTVPGYHSSYTLATNSEEERTRWVNAISQNSSSHDFYTLLAQKKRKLQEVTQSRQHKDSSSSLLRKKARNSSKSQSLVRKSQISLPLTTSLSTPYLNQSSSPSDDQQQSHSMEAGESSTVEYNYVNYTKKNPHSYFLTLPSTKSTRLAGAEGSFSSFGSFTSAGSQEDTSCLDENADEHSYKAEFLIKKYALPIQESTSSLLKRYEHLITPQIRVSEPRPHGIDAGGTQMNIESVPGGETGKESSTNQDDLVDLDLSEKVTEIYLESDDDYDYAELPEPDAVGTEVEGFRTTFVFQHQPQDESVAAVPKQTEPEVKHEESDECLTSNVHVLNIPSQGKEFVIPIVLERENDNDVCQESKPKQQKQCDMKDIDKSQHPFLAALPQEPSMSSDKSANYKRSTYKRDKSLEKHVEEILEKQKSIIATKTTDTESVNREIEEESRDLDGSNAYGASNARRQLERVTSFIHSITTTVVTKQLPLSAEARLETSFPHFCPVAANRSISDSELTCTSTNFLTNNNEPNVETYNSVLIGNVRHTEV